MVKLCVYSNCDFREISSVVKCTRTFTKLGPKLVSMFETYRFTAFNEYPMAISMILVFQTRIYVSIGVNRESDDFSEHFDGPLIEI